MIELIPTEALSAFAESRKQTFPADTVEVMKTGIYQMETQLGINDKGSLHSMVDKVVQATAKSILTARLKKESFSPAERRNLLLIQIALIVGVVASIAMAFVSFNIKSAAPILVSAAITAVLFGVVYIYQSKLLKQHNYKELFPAVYTEVAASPAEYLRTINLGVKLGMFRDFDYANSRVEKKPDEYILDNIAYLLKSVCKTMGVDMKAAIPDFESPDFDPDLFLGFGRTWLVVSGISLTMVSSFISMAKESRHKRFIHILEIMCAYNNIAAHFNTREQ